MPWIILRVGNSQWQRWAEGVSRRALLCSDWSWFSDTMWLPRKCPPIGNKGAAMRKAEELQKARQAAEHTDQSAWGGRTGLFSLYKIVLWRPGMDFCWRGL